MKSLFFLIVTFCTISSTLHNTIIEDPVKCSAELSVEKNRNSKSVIEGAIDFPLTLKNTSSSTTSYSISTKILQEACGNDTYKKSSNNNLEFGVSVKTDDSSTTSINEITLIGGQTHNFVITIDVPKGTPYNSWSCVEVFAKSLDCEDSDAAKTILSVYIPDPSDG
jgi:hypothetical protein